MVSQVKCKMPWIDFGPESEIEIREFPNILFCLHGVFPKDPIYLRNAPRPYRRYENMAKVTREMGEKAGVDVDHLIDLLVKNAAAEFTTFYYYTILRLNLIGLEGEGIKEIAEAAWIEDKNHFEALVPRIYESWRKTARQHGRFPQHIGMPASETPGKPKGYQGDAHYTGRS
jgi:hypothetical protein